MREKGFTLVEMLIALAIFGMLTAAGVALLSVTAVVATRIVAKPDLTVFSRSGVVTCTP